MTTGGATYNGVDIGSSPYGLIVARRISALIPRTRDRAVLIPGRPGTYDFGSELGERIIEIDGFINQSTGAALEAAVPAIAQLFDPTAGAQQLIFDTLSDRYFLAKLTGEPIVSRNVTTGQVKLTMRCADPFAYALAQTIASAFTTALTTYGDIDYLLIDSGPLDSYVLSATLTPAVGGTYKVDPVIQLTTSAGYVGSVTVQNVMTGETFTWIGSLASGDILKVDSSVQRVYVNGAVQMSGVQAGSVWPQLRAAQNNTIVLSGISASSISDFRVTFRNRWL